MTSDRDSEWVTVGRPGFLGRHRNEKIAGWNAKYGEGNWRLIWTVGDACADFLGACALYEDAYFEYLRTHPDVRKRLTSEASDVYDDEPSNVKSGFDYSKQETIRTHIQDIAIRRTLLRLGERFSGKNLIRIRHSMGNHPLSMTLSPGKVPFHAPDLIAKPELTGWWDPGTVEAFYQSNKILQSRRRTELEREHGSAH